ncbi:hypothetical protein [Halomicrococcus gelatinilyticus]|uniref:hypothetical protein n=1 Tax=Halomicrococcus gelatinilyticus TaxID=1702103 RepID=UPI002E106E4B
MERLEDVYGHEPGETDDSRFALSPEAYAVDLLAVAAVAVVLVLVMETRAPFRTSLVLDYADPALHALYTTHFVHGSTAHLRGNLTAYLVVVPLTYLVSLEAGRHREFRRGFLAVLFVVPPLVSLVSLFGLDLAVEALLDFDPDVQTSRGFSSLVGAFAGVLLVATADLLRTATDRDGPLWPVVGVLFCYGLAVAFLDVFRYTAGPLAVVLVALPLLYAVWLLRTVERVYRLRETVLSADAVRRRPVALGLLVTSAVVSGWAVAKLLAFPPFAGGTNTLAHLTGLLLGVCCSALQLGELRPRDLR